MQSVLSIGYSECLLVFTLTKEKFPHVFYSMALNFNISSNGGFPYCWDWFYCMDESQNRAKDTNSSKVGLVSWFHNNDSTHDIFSNIR